MNKIILTVLSSILVLSCSPKIAPIEKRIVGEYRVAVAHCGANQDTFIYMNFTRFILEEDGTGVDYQTSLIKPFEWVVIDDRLQICYTTSSNSILIPFKLEGDTLKLRRSNNFCSQLNVHYVKD